MDDQTRDNLTDQATWMRLLYIVLFTIAFKIAALLAGIVTVVQFFTVLFTKSPNARLRSLGGDLGDYVRDVVRFLTFETDHMPYPVSDWGQPTDAQPKTKARAKAATKKTSAQTDDAD